MATPCVDTCTTSSWSTSITESKIEDQQVAAAIASAKACVTDLQSSLTCMGANAVRYIHSLPTHAHIRQQLINILNGTVWSHRSGTAHDSGDIPTVWATQLFDCSAATISKSQHAPLHSLETKHVTNDEQPRQRLHKLETDAITQWIPTVSNTIMFTRQQV